LAAQKVAFESIFPRKMRDFVLKKVLQHGFRTLDAGRNNNAKFSQMRTRSIDELRALTDQQMRQRLCSA
jgi:hypothetical protein